MLARYYLYMAMCSSVRLSVTSRCSIETNGRIELVFSVGSFFHLSCTLLTGNSGTFKIRVLPSGTLSQTSDNFVPNFGLRKFCFDISIVEKCHRLSSRKVDAQSVTNWAVVGQLSWQYLRAPTLDHCCLSRVIDKLCLQRDTVARVS